MVDLLLKSGKFDVLAIAHVRNIDNGIFTSINNAIPDKPVIKFIDIDSVAPQLNRREIAETWPTVKDHDQDDSTGVHTTTASNTDELMAIAGF